jgi:hypothetical protein
MSVRSLRLHPSLLFSVLALIIYAPARAAVVTTNADSGPGSLRQTVLDASSGDTITFTNTLSGATILLTGAQILLNNSLTIDGSSLSNGISIDGNGNPNNRIFEMQTGTTNHLISLTLTNGLASGGAVRVQTGAFGSINNCTIVGNKGGAFTQKGGGINNDGTLEICDSTITDNTAADIAGEGGGIYNGDNGSITVKRCSLSDNTAGSNSQFGGAIYNRGTAIIISCTLSNNSAGGAAGGNGGGIYDRGTLSVSDSLFIGNSASDGGGGLYSVFESLTLERVVFQANSASQGGGLLAADLATLTDCLFTNNLSANRGGAVSIGHGTGTVTRCTFAANSATNQAGALWISTGDITLSSSTFTANIAGDDGGGIYQADGTLILNGATIVSNSAAVSGGGVEKAGGNIFITNSIVSLNTAPSDPNLGGGFTEGCNNLLGGDPLLFPLGNFGGDTPTMPPMLGSPVIDAGLTSATNSPTDQRGFPRVLSAGLAAPAVDIGACEFNGWLVGMDLTLLDTNLLYVPPGSVYDSSTVFPPEIDPVALGLMKVQSQSEINDLIAEGEANVTNNPAAYGLFTESAFQALALDRPFLTYDSVSNNFTLTLGVLQAPDLFTTFSNLTGFTTIPDPGNGRIDVEFPPPNSDVRFYQVFGAEPTP